MRNVHCARVRLICGLLALVLCIVPALATATYTVRPGDTLSRLAQRLSIPLSALLACNHIANPDVIYVGQQLTLPDNTVVPATQPSRSASPRELQQQRAQYAEQHSTRGDRIVTAARAFLGTRYSRGGVSRSGIDCSGLIVRAMGAQGMNVPHHAATLYHMGTRVTYEQLQAGDLLFFNTNGRGVSHVGIWVGNNRFIHASSSRGVVIDTVAGYYAQRLVGARRLH